MRKFLLFLFLLSFLFPINVFAIVFPETNSKVVLVYDRTDSNILYEMNSNNVSSIASLTKIVTTIVSINKISNLDDKVIISNEIMNSVDSSASKAGLKVGDVVTYRDLLYASILPSGADATNALAISLSGSIDNFVNDMNSLVSELNLSDTHFVNVTGLDISGHYSTASDICKLLDYSLNNELFKQIYTTKKYTLSNGLDVYSTLYKYNGEDISNIIGSKTGYTGNAGYCISTLSLVDDHEIITILLDAEHIGNSYHNIIDAKNIVNFLESNYKNQLLSQKQVKIYSLPVLLSDDDNYDILSSVDVYKFLPNDYDTSLFRYEYIGLNDLNYKNQKGDVIGHIDYYYDDCLLASENVILNKNFKFNFYKFFKLYYYVFLIILFVILIIFFIIFKSRRRRLNDEKVI